MKGAWRPPGRCRRHHLKPSERAIESGAAGRAPVWPLTPRAAPVEVNMTMASRMSSTLLFSVARCSAVSVGLEGSRVSLLDEGLGRTPAKARMEEQARTFGACSCQWGTLHPCPTLLSIRRQAVDAFVCGGERLGVGAAYADGRGDKLEEAPGLITALRHRLLIGRLGPADCSPPA